MSETDPRRYIFRRRVAVPHDWIIEVLDDLRTYAQENRLHRLATEIADLRLVAMTEIASADAPGVPACEPQDSVARCADDLFLDRERVR